MSQSSKKPIDKTHSQDPAAIELVKLYEKTSRNGAKYFIGRLGLAKVVLMPDGEASDGSVVWRLLVQEPDAEAGQ